MTQPVLLTPDQFQSASAYDLLRAAATGHAGIDQRWLRAMLDRGAAAVPDIIRFGREAASTDDFPIPLEEELVAILRHIGSPESIPYFMNLLRSEPDESVLENVVAALFPFRDQIVDQLLEVYEELGEERGGEVLFLLAAFRKEDPRILPLLTEYVEYDAADGALYLGMYGDPAARPVLERLREEVKGDSHLVRYVDDALEALGRPLEADEPEPFDIFEMFPERTGPDTGVLSEEEVLALLDSPDPEYRFTAAAEFINSDLDDRIRGKLFEHARTDEDVKVRAKCWEALSGIIEDDEEVYQAMLARLQDEAAPLAERAGALVGLGQRADREPVRAQALKFYENPETRAAAMAAMWNSLDRTFAQYFPQHLDDENPDVKRQAISGVGYLGITASSEKLREFFEDEDFRANALFAYALSARAEISPGRVRPLLRRIEKLAGGLGTEEEELVKIALDERLMLHGHKPVFHPQDHEHHHHDHDHDHEGHDHHHHH